MFRPSRSSSDLPRKQIQELFSFPALWDPKSSQVSITEAKVYKLVYKLNLLCDRFDRHTTSSIYIKAYILLLL